MTLGIEEEMEMEMSSTNRGAMTDMEIDMSVKAVTDTNITMIEVGMETRKPIATTNFEVLNSEDFLNQLFPVGAA